MDVSVRRAVRDPRVDVAAVFVLALATRLGMVWASPGGITGNFGYDASVYYAAADALVHGRLPYSDFVLLHPPGIMLALTPFATLGRIVGDDTGFATANTAFSVIGALNAVLVLLIARRLGCDRRAAVLGAVFYAVWFGAVCAELCARLEPLGSLAFLGGVLLLTGAVPHGRAELHARAGSHRTVTLVAAGAALAAATTVKIWWIVPVLLVLGWHVLGARRRALWPLLAGMVGTVAVIDGPFLVASHGAMWRMVVLDQIGRPADTSALNRLRDLTSVGVAYPSLAGSALTAALLLALLVVVAAVVAAVRSLVAMRTADTQPGATTRTAIGGLVVAVAVAQLGVLVVAPSFFVFYADYAAGALSLVIALAACRRPDTPTGRARRRAPSRVGSRVGPLTAGVAVALAAAMTATVVLARPDRAALPFPGASLAAKVAGKRCVMADSPMALIELDVLSRDLSNHCPNWIDVTGRTYDVDDEPLSRPANRLWQRDLRRYLLSGDAVIVIRDGTGLAPATMDAVTDHPVLDRSHGYTVYLVRHRGAVPDA